jgi:hypothetical protein
VRGVGSSNLPVPTIDTREVHLIPLTKGYHAVVDRIDKPLVEQFAWHADEHRRKDGSIMVVYAARAVKGKKRQLLHRFLLGIADPKIRVDHRDHDGLNCRRLNLRIATNTENVRYQRKQHRGSSQYKGASWHVRKNKWVASIRVNRKLKFLGSFASEINAAIAYDVAARKHFGRFAVTNFWVVPPDNPNVIAHELFGGAL